MGLFAVDYRDVQGQCVYAQGGLKFRADEEALRRYFSQILPYVSLNDLIGEAVFWVLFPSSLAIWTFPFLLYFKGVVFALVIAVGLFLVAGIGHQYIYLKSVNYLVFILGNRLLQLAGYVVWVLVFLVEGSLPNTLILGAWFISFALGLGDLILGLFPILFQGKLFSLPVSDQVLRTVGIHYGAKFGADQETIYAGSGLSKFFGFVSFLGLLSAVIALISLQWGAVITGLVVFLAAAYVGYRAAGGRRNPALQRLDTESTAQWDPEQVAMFELLERIHGDDYQAIINELYFGFARASRGKVMALRKELADAFEEAKRNPSAETWHRLKIAMRESL